MSFASFGLLQVYVKLSQMLKISSLFQIVFKISFVCAIVLLQSGASTCEPIVLASVK